MVRRWGPLLRPPCSLLSAAPCSSWRACAGSAVVARWSAHIAMAAMQSGPWMLVAPWRRSPRWPPCPMVSAKEAKGSPHYLSAGLTGNPKLRHLGLPGLGGGIQKDLWKAAALSQNHKGETPAKGHGWAVGLPSGRQEAAVGWGAMVANRHRRCIKKCDLGPFWLLRASEPNMVPPLQAPSPAKPSTRFCGETVNLGRWGAWSPVWVRGCVSWGTEDGLWGTGASCECSSQVWRCWLRWLPHPHAGTTLSSSVAACHELAMVTATV